MSRNWPQIQRISPSHFDYWLSLNTCQLVGGDPDDVDILALTNKEKTHKYTEYEQAASGTHTSCD